MKRLFIVASAALVLAACASSQPGGQSATATVRPASGSSVSGMVKFTEMGERVRVDVQLTGLSKGGTHGFHIHEKGDCSAADAMSAGGHFNPEGRKHGGPATVERHAGDLGNLQADGYGKGEVSFVTTGISVGRGAGNVIGRAFVIHASPDDLKTDPTGNSGARIGCGTIQ